jgi:hypothetical protein
MKFPAYSRHSVSHVLGNPAGFSAQREFGVEGVLEIRDGVFRLIHATDSGPDHRRVLRVDDPFAYRRVTEQLGLPTPEGYWLLTMGIIWAPVRESADGWVLHDLLALQCHEWADRGGSFVLVRPELADSE